MNWKDVFRLKKSAPLDLVEMEYKDFRDGVADKGVEIYEKKLAEEREATDWYPVTTNLVKPINKFKNSVVNIADYYLYRMEKYWESEGLFFRIANKIVELILEEGFTYEGSPNDLNSYTKMMNLLYRTMNPKYTDYTFKKRIIHDTVVYGNCFIQFIKDGNVIVDIKIHDPLSIKVVQDKDTDVITGYIVFNGKRRRGDLDKQLRKPRNNIIGKYLNYMPGIRYIPTDKPEDFIPYDEMCHIRYYNTAQTALSMPPLYSVVDDLIALRSIEDDISLLSFQYGHPFLHATIEREKLTGEQIKLESDYLAERLTKIEGNGFLVTSDRVKVELKGPNGNLPDLAKFHSLFRSRVSQGSGIPDIFIGEGGGLQRQSSEVVKGSVYSFINDFGKTIAEQLQEKLVDEIVNRNLKRIYNKANLFPSGLSIKFYDADSIEVRANEQHYGLLFQTNAITHGELRTLLKKPVDPTMADKYFSDISQENTMQQLEHQGAIALKTKAVGAAETPGQAKKIASQQTATNQHGRKTKAGTVKDNEQEESTNIEEDIKE